MTDNYIIFEPNEPYTFDPTISPLQFACCDCFLVHKFYFKVNKDRTITFNLEVDEEETERLRKNPNIKDEAFKNIQIDNL